MLYDCLGCILMLAIIMKIAAFRQEEETLLDYRRIRDYENRNW